MASYLIIIVVGALVASAIRRVTRNAKGNNPMPGVTGRPPRRRRAAARWPGLPGGSNAGPAQTLVFRPGGAPTYKPGDSATYKPGDSPTYKPGNSPTYQPGTDTSYQPAQAPASPRPASDPSPAGPTAAARTQATAGAATDASAGSAAISSTALNTTLVTHYQPSCLTTSLSTSLTSSLGGPSSTSTSTTESGEGPALRLPPSVSDQVTILLRGGDEAGAVQFVVEELQVGLPQATRAVRSMRENS